MARRETRTGSTMRDRARQRAEEREKTGGGFKYNLPEGVKFWQPKKGTQLIDILPYRVTETANPDPRIVKGEDWYQRTVWVHFNIGPEERSYLCPKTIGKKCPICDERIRLQKSGNVEEDIIKGLLPKERELFNVLDLNDEDKGIQLWEFSYHLFGKKLEEEIREGDDEIAAFADLQEGFTIKIRLAEKKLGSNTFLEASRIDFEDRDPYKDDDKVLDEVIDLGKILNVLEYEDLEKIFYGEGDGKDRDEDKGEEEPEPPRRRRGGDREEPEPERSRRTRGRSEPEPEPEKPSRRTRGRVEPEPEPEKEPSRSRRTRGRAEPEPSGEDSECPHNHDFGTDCDTTDDCAACENDTWEACRERKDEIEAEEKKSRRGK